ncbi:hypothetical protein HF909_07915 [Ralstonia pseudosolanacearum]|uniref:Uncharacterized protein n=1 Tax=Ralstonia solanacearum TaxID=305 RepID=A0AA92K117_RALSL|nr:hypothetical protein HF909_07915 [Ralstonia pseudosolanacearum]
MLQFGSVVQAAPVEMGAQGIPHGAGIHQSFFCQFDLQGNVCQFGALFWGHAFIYRQWRRMALRPPARIADHNFANLDVAVTFGDALVNGLALHPNLPPQSGAAARQRHSNSRQRERKDIGKF